MATGWSWVLPLDLSFINVSAVPKLQLALSFVLFQTQVTGWEESMGGSYYIAQGFKKNKQINQPLACYVER